MVFTSAFKYLFGTTEDAQKQGINTLIYSAVGIIVIILANTMVEAIFGKYEAVVLPTGLAV